MDSHEVLQGADLSLDVTLRDPAGAPVTGYTGAETLTATLGTTDNQLLVATPTATWVTPPALVNVLLSRAQTATIPPGAYRLELVVDAATTDDEGYRATVTILRSAVSEAAPGTPGAKPASVGPTTLAQVYATDEDVADRAPMDYLPLCPKWQRLAFGTDGVFFAAAPWALCSTASDFQALGVAAGNVVALDRPQSAFPSPELFAVDAVQPNICWLRRLGQPYGTGQPPAPNGLTGVRFEVRTFERQLEIASYDANHEFGIEPDVPGRTADLLRDPRELQQYVALTVLERMYVSADVEKAGDYDRKLALVRSERSDLKGRLQVTWGPQGAGAPANSVFATQYRR